MHTQGHWNGRTAVVHYDRWVTYRSRGMRYDWVVSCTTYAGAQSHYSECRRSLAQGLSQ